MHRRETVLWICGLLAACGGSDGKDGMPAIYRTNLAIFEAYVTRTGPLFVWPPSERRTRFVGKAATLDPPLAGLFPLGTEIVHSVLYLDVEGDRVRMPSASRALDLDRAWLSHVRAQRFGLGREVLTRAPRIERVMIQDAPTGLSPIAL